MASAAALATVQKLYIAYYGRPADAGGREYWASELDKAGGSLAGIINSFAGAAEAQALYGSGTTTADRVTVLYQNILGRTPDPQGLAYYAGEVDAGRLSLGSLALAILDGVQPTSDDAPLANNRLTVADAFTAQVNDQNYGGDAAAAIARTFLQQVTGDAATASQANGQLPAYLNTMGVATRQPDKFAPLIANGLLTNTAIVSTTLTEQNLDEALKALAPTTGDTIAPTALLSSTPSSSMVQLEALGQSDGKDEHPQLTALGSGGEFVVTWHGVDSAGDFSIFVQKFAANGTPTGNRVQLEALNRTDKTDWAPQLTALGSGGEFVVTWYGIDSAGDNSIFVQKFAANGSPAGSMVQLEALGSTDGSDLAPQITALGSSGEFVVTWYGNDSDVGDNSIFVQKFAANGSPTGSIVQLEALGRSNADDRSPQITALGSSGEFVVTWHGVDSAGDFSIFVQKFAANGTPRGGMVQLEALGNTTGFDYAPQITAVGSGGDFVVTWSGQDSAGDDSIFVQKFAADGTPAGLMVQLEALGKTNGNDTSPQITALGSGGDFVVTWHGIDSTGDDSIFVQKYAANGTPRGSMVQLEALGNTTGRDYAPQITAVGSGGEFVVTWSGQDSAGDYSIFVQKFAADGTPAGSMVQLEALGNATGFDYLPQITALGSGGEFAVTWYGIDSAGDTSIFVQPFTATGQVLPGTVQVNNSTPVTVQSSETGTAYLVKSTVTVNTLADITSAQDALWNQVAIATANTDTALPTTGLENGSYKIYTADAAGNLSAPVTGVEVVGVPG